MLLVREWGVEGVEYKKNPWFFLKMDTLMNSEWEEMVYEVLKSNFSSSHMIQITVGALRNFNS